MSNITLFEMFLSIFQILTLVWPIWLLIGAIISVRLIRKIYLTRRFRRAGMIDVDRFTGRQFEQYLQFLFEKLGFQTELTPPQGDFGADLILERDGLRTAVQAKRSAGTVGVEAIQQVVAAMPFYECNRAIVVTNSYFSKRAKELAKVNLVELWDRQKLTSVALSLHKLAAVPPLLRITEPPPIQDIQSPAFAPMDKLATPTKFAKTNGICKICGAPVTPGVRRYCLDQPDRFGGEVYCIQHQKQFKEYPKSIIPTTN
ncbi:MAG: restriction endonuclease [Caldilineaceae bacterium]